MPMSDADAQKFINDAVTFYTDQARAESNAKRLSLYQTWRSHTSTIANVVSKAASLIQAAGRQNDLTDFENYVNANIHEGNYTS